MGNYSVAAGRATNSRPRLKDMVGLASHLDLREEKIADLEQKFQSDRRVLLVVYDALDTISNQWPRRRLLTEALFEVMWAMRAYGRGGSRASAG